MLNHWHTVLCILLLLFILLDYIYIHLYICMHMCVLYKENKKIYFLNNLRSLKKTIWNRKYKNKYINTHCIGSVNYLFFLENALKKKLLNIFSNLFFYMKVQSFQLIMENNFIHMAASAGHDPTRSVQFLSTLSIVCSCILTMASRILSFKASIVSDLLA